MDANGQRFWMARGGLDWAPAPLVDLQPECLRLASESNLAIYPEVPADAEARLALVPQAADPFGCRAFYDSASQTIQSTGAFPDAVVIAAVPAGATDLATGFDGCLYIATGGGVLAHDLSIRFVDTTVTLPGFAAWRIAADPAGGAWVLDRKGRQLARVTGQLWPAQPDIDTPDVFRPAVPNPQPLRLALVTKPWLAADEDPVALACSPGGRAIMLTWTVAGARLRLLSASGPLGVALTLQKITRPFSVAWISETRVAVLAAGVREAIVYTVPADLATATQDAWPVGDIYPLRDHDGSALLHGISWPVEYIAVTTKSGQPPQTLTRPLVAASLPSFAASGTTGLVAPFDSGADGTAWHRLYIEAEIPAQTSFTLRLAASDNISDPAQITDPADWHAHHFGNAPAIAPGEPVAAWCSEASELPFQAGFLDVERVPQRAGLFTVLIQRPNRPVRTLRGRVLHIRIELRATLRATPAIFALRAYGPRFSYQDQYLPALYRETLSGSDANDVAAGSPSTRADFLGRFLANFEGVLTPLEDKIASAWLLTDARTTPDETLPWLGSWIGVAFAPWYPAAQRRSHLRNAPELFRTRGTMKGLKLALDIVTGGGVGQGRIVVLEDYWFRRSLQTILGLDLDEADDPLFGGPVISGNSIVGDTLFLSEQGLEEKFLALFNASAQLSTADQQTIDDYFSSLAFRATVVVHDQTSPQEMTLISRVTALESPAHVSVQVRNATEDFLVGLAALIGADTYIRGTPVPPPVQLDTSQLGDGSRLIRPPSLDPRLENAPS